MLITQTVTFSVTTSPVAWLLTVGYAVSIILGLVLVIRGFQYLDPGLGGIIGLMEIVFGVLLGVLLFQESLTLTVVIGSAMIMFASLLPLWRKEYFAVLQRFWRPIGYNNDQ